MNLSEIYKEIYKYDDLIIQSNLDGYYTKRIKVTPETIGSIPHNHRKIAVNELIFDIDVHNRVISNEVHDHISSKLVAEGINHQVWDTTRSPHIHAFFEGLNLYSREIRCKIKLLMLEHYSGNLINWIDKSKVSENQMIRDFGSVHEITRKSSKLIYETANQGLNKVPNHIIEEMRVIQGYKAKMPKIAPIEVTGEYKQKIKGFIDYCQCNKFNQDGRERILFREVTKSCILLGYNIETRHQIYKIIAFNCPGRKESELISWDKFFQKQNINGINWRCLEAYGYGLQQTSNVNNTNSR